MFVTAKQAAEQWGISDRRVRILCSEGRIPGAYQKGRGWKIPIDAIKPADGRYKSSESLLERIDRKKQELDSMHPFTEGEAARLAEEFMIEYTYNSNALDGNTLTLRETDRVLRGFMIDQKPLRDQMEVIGHKDAFEFVCKLARERAPVSEDVIKQIHYLAFPDKIEDRGVYRRIPVRVMDAKREPVRPCLIQPQMERLLERYHESGEHIISRLAHFHVEFERIRPFIDGNGTTGRLLVNLELMKAGYPPIDIRFADHAVYDHAFDEYYGKHNVSAMEKLFAEYVKEHLDIRFSVLRDSADDVPVRTEGQTGSVKL